MTSEHDPQKQPEAVRVLLVDDDATFRRAMAKALGRKGLVVSELSGGAAAIELLLALSPARVHAAALELADRLSQGLWERGHRLLLPRGGGLRSPIVTFIPAGGAAVDKLAGYLLAQRVACSRRAGGIRLAPHAFNTDEDVARFLQALDELQESGRAGAAHAG